MVRWPPDRTPEQVADPVLQDAVRRKPDRVLDPFGFKIFVDIRIGEGGIGAEIDARDLAAIARHDTIKHTLPAIGAVDVAGTKRAALQIAELIEHPFPQPGAVLSAFASEQRNVFRVSVTTSSRSAATVIREGSFGDVRFGMTNGGPPLR
jgi:hypothetical protein